MKKILGLIAVISLATLTACGQLSSAATLGDMTISQNELQTTVDTLLKERATQDVSQMQLETGATLNRSQLRFLIITKIFDEIAKELKLDVTKTELATTRQGLVDQGGGESALAGNLVAAQIASTNFDKYIRAIIISDKLTAALKESGVADADVSTKISELVVAKTTELKIKINPRYGTWDNASGDIVAADSAGDAVTSPATK
ncbi:SurA N-terminal domain containing protein [Candidatus Nanopelagicaceae bacterium]